MNTNKKYGYFILFASIVIFYSFGFYHLSKFETVDEHFWKYDRIPQYWEAVKEGKWKKTYINDKPGITTTLISGIGLLREPDIKEHKLRDALSTNDGIYTVFDVNRTKKINLSLRLPLLLANGIFVLYFFWVIKKLTQNNWLSAFSALFISTSSTLIGITQIINPDAFLWSSSGAAVFSYFARLKTQEKKFLLLTGLFTGLALLSKYTALILFPLYILILFSNFFFSEKSLDPKNAKNYFLKELAGLATIYLISVFLYAFFLPASVLKLKYLYRGTVGFLALPYVWIPLLAVIAFTLGDIFLLRAKALDKIKFYTIRYRQILIRFFSTIMFFIFTATLVNVWLNQTIVPLEALRDSAMTEGKMDFGGMLDQDNILTASAKKILVQFYPLVFSLSPLVVFLLLSLWLKIIWKGQQNNFLLVFVLTLFPLIYLSAHLCLEVLVNTRYSIMLYPLAYFLAAISAYEIAIHFSKKYKENILIIFTLIIAGSGIISLWITKPFYLTYTSNLLPKKFILTDGWGYGDWEAAQYLNSLPNASELVIWPDRNGICQFIKGKCLSSYKIDLGKVNPDYFVISRRGEIRHRFVWKYPELAKKSAAEYYAKVRNDYEWSLDIDGRTDNYVRIIKSEENE